MNRSTARSSQQEARLKTRFLQENLCRHDYEPRTCPFCFPKSRRLSEFGKVGIQTKAGIYTEEIILDLERSHEELLSMAFYWAAKSIKSGEKIMLDKLNGIIQRAGDVRKKAGIL